jgi:pimeloyl-ACP methyl ester carboxylesterase
MADARFVAFDDSGHAPFLEEGDRYRQEILDFLGGL